MNYELAKKLKDAGFPLESSVEFREEETYDFENGGRYKIPTLSELIEVCGDGLKMLISPHKEEIITFEIWMAVSKVGQITEKGEWCFWDFHYGSTPEEAVANLWLELNKK